MQAGLCCSSDQAADAAAIARCGDEGKGELGPATWCNAQSHRPSLAAVSITSPLPEFRVFFAS